MQLLAELLLSTDFFFFCLENNGNGYKSENFIDVCSILLSLYLVEDSWNALIVDYEMGKLTGSLGLI